MDQYTPSYNPDRAARDHTALLLVIIMMVASAFVVVFMIAPDSSSPVSRDSLSPEATDVKQPVLALAGGFPGVLVAPGEGAMRQLGGPAPLEFPDVPDRAGVMLQTEVGVWIAPATGAGANELLLVRNGLGAAPGVQRIALPASVQGAEVRAMAAGLGRLWIGTSRGLLSYDWGRFNPYTPPSRFSLKGSTPNTLDVTALYLDHAGTLWIGTRDGLHSYNGTESFRHTVKEGLPDNAVTALSGDASGLLVVGTERGLATFDRGVWVRQGEITDMVTAVLAADDQLFVGTVSGLHQRLEGRWTQITGSPEAPLPTPVTSLAWGPDGLYIGTKQGLYRLAPKRVAAKDTAQAPAGAAQPSAAPAGH